MVAGASYVKESVKNNGGGLSRDELPADLRDGFQGRSPGVGTVFGVDRVSYWHFTPGRLPA